MTVINVACYRIMCAVALNRCVCVVCETAAVFRAIEGFSEKEDIRLPGMLHHTVREVCVYVG